MMKASFELFWVKVLVNDAKKFKLAKLSFDEKLVFLAKWLNPNANIPAATNQPIVEEMLEHWAQLSSKTTLTASASLLQDFRNFLEKDLTEMLKGQIPSVQYINAIKLNKVIAKQTPLTQPDPERVKKVTKLIQDHRLIKLNNLKIHFSSYTLKTQTKFIAILAKGKQAAYSILPWVRVTQKQLVKVHDDKAKQDFFDEIMKLHQEKFQQVAIEKPRKALTVAWTQHKASSHRKAEQRHIAKSSEKAERKFKIS